MEPSTPYQNYQHQLTVVIGLHLQRDKTAGHTGSSYNEQH